jgi:uncharacterized Zn finger protein
MHEHDPKLTQDNSARVLSSCPQCDTELAILRVIAGRGGCEYWTMRCPRCGGIHLDIVGLSRPPLTA